MQAHIDTMTSIFDGNIVVEDGRVTVKNERALSGPQMDTLVREAVFGDEATRDYARWLLWEIGQAVGVRPSSIHDLYLARGRGEVHGFTVPAVNVRAATYDTVRSIFRVAKKMDAGAFIFEIARSEIAYTDQRPTEYVAVIIGAALREGFRGPVFIQGDHFQVNHKKYAVDPKTEVDSVKQLVTEAVAAGFYNIDIDTSTLVDISKKTLDEQQRLNYEVGIDILKHVRAQQPEGVNISVGGEIGEVGTANSTVEELRAYMDGFERTRRKQAPDAEGLSKISVQSGTSHGGVVLADGSIADVAIDFNTLETLSKVARDDYGLAGAVQHGASTLPDSAFHNFPKLEVAEIHLATNF
ncbi:MAG: aldolase, partial [Gemmatimonadaceae bacterium]|nr:aldolase [Gemmatimonadaceae bacterium]